MFHTAPVNLSELGEKVLENPHKMAFKVKHYWDYKFYILITHASDLLVPGSWQQAECSLLYILRGIIRRKICGDREIYLIKCRTLEYILKCARAVCLFLLTRTESKRKKFCLAVVTTSIFLNHFITEDVKDFS